MVSLFFYLNLFMYNLVGKSLQCIIVKYIQKICNNNVLKSELSYTGYSFWFYFILKIQDSFSEER